MKALIQKEIRDHLKTGLFGMAILTLMVGSAFRDCPTVLDLVALLTLFFCAVFGALLGWLQTFKENNRDRWAFLIHRPMTRTEIFASKVIAGMAIYLTAAGLPLLGVVLLARVLDERAVPFEWDMALPVVAGLLTGIVCYFAGMLTGLRQARWYASRGLGLAVAFLVLWLVFLPETSPTFAWSLLWILISGGLLAPAAWASFSGGGYYRGQPPAGKLALTGSMAAGSGVVVLFVAGLLAVLVQGLLGLERNPPPRQYTDYQMEKDGTILKLGRGVRPEQIGLDGKPILDARTGWPITAVVPIGPDKSPDQVWMDIGDQLHLNDNYWNSPHYFKREWAGAGAYDFTSWVFSYRYQRMLGRDSKTSRFIGSIGPKGFVMDSITAADRFDLPLPNTRLYTAANVAYLIDFKDRTNMVFFTAPEGEHMIAAADITPKGSYDWKYSVLVTERSVYLLTPEGRLVWKAPFQPGPPAYSHVRVYLLEPPGQFALWLGPRRKDHAKVQDTLPIQVAWLSSGQGIVKSADLPPLPNPPRIIELRQKIAATVIPPVLNVLLAERDQSSWSWVLAQLSLAAAAICAVAGWWLGRRYKPGLPAQLGWAAFHVLFGVPAFLAYLSVQERPALEACPKCKKLRTVDRERCEPCGATFAPPQKNGTEIFEVLGTGSTNVGHPVQST